MSNFGEELKRIGIDPSNPKLQGQLNPEEKKILKEKVNETIRLFKSVKEKVSPEDAAYFLDAIDTIQFHIKAGREPYDFVDKPRFKKVIKTFKALEKEGMKIPKNDMLLFLVNSYVEDVIKNMIENDDEWTEKNIRASLAEEVKLIKPIMEEQYGKNVFKQFEDIIVSEVASREPNRKKIKLRRRKPVRIPRGFELIVPKRKEPEPEQERKEKVKLPSNPWVFFVKELSKQTGESYACLLTKPSTKTAYEQYKATLGDIF